MDYRRLELMFGCLGLDFGILFIDSFFFFFLGYANYIYIVLFINMIQLQTFNFNFGEDIDIHSVLEGMEWVSG